ncbi:uncharacterized protein LOC111240554 [Vigna radiata var. radiata]|uniref:Uncharacterized protein LOC111240554 n=1 Tax=Vigna radiata var. radiata TaxID=3916 RepID=A0A3Q0EMI7_VIGRR|nr:uncharacterized protein LOC111240554 [Vigna radiata var. radiata]
MNSKRVDIEFLGTTFGKPYTLQTNVYIRGSGDGRIIGREMKFHLWFGPTKDKVREPSHHRHSDDLVRTGLHCRWIVAAGDPPSVCCLSSTQPPRIAFEPASKKAKPRRRRCAVSSLLQATVPPPLSRSSKTISCRRPNHPMTSKVCRSTFLKDLMGTLN